MMTPDKAWEIILARCSPLASHDQPLMASLECVLAENVVADRDLPPADRAAMDGYVVRSLDLGHPPVTLPVAAEVVAGVPPPAILEPGTCQRIYTGANLPAGGDAVVMLEDVAEPSAPTAEWPTPAADAPASVTFRSAVAPGVNVLHRGEHGREGDVLVSAGEKLTPARIATAAAVGRASLRVHRTPSVAIVSTGAELVQAGDPARPHQSRDSNAPLLEAACREAGYVVVARCTVTDRLDGIAARIVESAALADVVVITGGASVGKYDLATKAVQRAGGVIHFHGVAMKPGKPVFFATLGPSVLVFGLPGNPLSAATGFFEFVLPALERVAGVAPERVRPTLHVRLLASLSTDSERRLHLPARLVWKPDGLWADVLALGSSADVVVGARADGVVLAPPGRFVAAAGDVLPFRPWRALP